MIGEDIAEILMPCGNEVSPYDPSFPIKLLSNSLKARMEQADRAAKAIYTAVAKESPVLAQTCLLYTSRCV